MQQQIDNNNCYNYGVPNMQDTYTNSNYGEVLGNQQFANQPIINQQLNGSPLIGLNNSKLRLKRFFNRIIFVILELLSLPLTYLMCIIFKVLMKIEGSIIGDYNLVFLALWLFVVYKIYSKFKYKIK